MAKAKNNAPAQPTTDPVQAASVAPLDPPETPITDPSAPVADPEPSPSDEVAKDDKVAEIQTYRVNWPLHGFQGTSFVEGDILESEPEEAAQLVEFGVLSPVVVEAEG